MGTTLIIIYIISVVLMYLHVKISHSKNGQYYHRPPDFADVLLTITPFVNTVLALISWIFDYPYKHNFNYFDKFFRIKR